MIRAKILHIPPGSEWSSASSHGAAWAGWKPPPSAHLALAAGSQPLPPCSPTARAHPDRAAQGPSQLAPLRSTAGGTAAWAQGRVSFRLSRTTSLWGATKNQPNYSASVDKSSATCSGLWNLQRLIY